MFCKYFASYYLLMRYFNSFALQTTEWFTNHRMVETRGDLWRLSSPNTPLKHASLRHISQNCVQEAFEYLQEGDSTTYLSNLCQYSITLTVNNFFLMLTWHCLCFSLCLLALVLSVGTTVKSLASFS